MRVVSAVLLTCYRKRCRLPTGKTFEVRRSEAADARGKSMTHRAFQQLFLQLAQDRHRPRVGLWPFPKAVPPPPPPTEERKQAGFFHSAPAPCWDYCYRQVGVKASSFCSCTCAMSLESAWDAMRKKQPLEPACPLPECAAGTLGTGGNHNPLQG